MEPFGLWWTIPFALFVIAIQSSDCNLKIVLAWAFREFREILKP